MLLEINIEIIHWGCWEIPVLYYNFCRISIGLNVVLICKIFLGAYNFILHLKDMFTPAVLVDYFCLSSCVTVFGQDVPHLGFRGKIVWLLQLETQGTNSYLIFIGAGWNFSLLLYGFHHCWWQRHRVMMAQSHQLSLKTSWITSTLHILRGRW